ncbi:MAG: C25 family cysteine peptidase [bacterium]|nr:C25 family cysteine peptidase [bacterium]
MFPTKYLLILLLSANSLFAGQITKVITFNTDDFSFQKNNGYDVVSIKGAGFTTIPGFPMIPQKATRFVIPGGAVITDYEIISGQSKDIQGYYNIYPSQKPHTISFPGKSKWVTPDARIYNQNSVFPESIITHSHTGNMGGYTIATFLVSPLQYIPAQNKLVLTSEIKIQIHYKENKSPLLPKTEKQKNIFANILKDKVLNPEDISLYSTKGLLTDSVEYVIITTDSLISSFQPLADWKTKKGVSTRIVSLASIYSGYSGRDNAEKIRNFIKYANTNLGTLWVLLGGQCDYENGQEIVPRRNVYYMTSGEGKYDDEDTIPSDLYFSDLDGTWNNDNDAVWGEKPQNGDTVDLYSDVFVGRAPVLNKTQTQNFVNKVLTYEKNPPSGYLKRMFLPTAELFDKNNGIASAEAITAITPSGWQDIKLYEVNAKLSRKATIDTINSGVAFTHLVGHGRESGVYLYIGGGTYLSSANVDTLSNGNKRGIFNSIACFAGAVDEVYNGDCLAEHLINTQGGGVASIMSSRYGWGDETGILWYSEAVDTSFYGEVFNGNHWHLGEAHAVSKDNFVSYAAWNSELPWVIYELNLFGDPEMPMWTDAPSNLSVSCEDTIMAGETSLQVTVTGASIPVSNAYVCAMKSNEVYARGYTNVSGQVSLILPQTYTAGALYLTVTKHNYIPLEDTITVKAVGAEEPSISDFGLGNAELKIRKDKICLSVPNNPLQADFASLNNRGNKVSLKIYDLCGRMTEILYTGTLEKGNYVFTPNIHKNGIYFVKLISGKQRITQKLILLR